MIAILSATEMELEFFREKFKKEKRVKCFEIGIGIVKSLISTYEILKEFPEIDTVFLFGIGGGFYPLAEILDVCVAEEEIIGDFGIWNGEELIPLGENSIKFDLDINCENLKKGRFITVNCTSVDMKRTEFFLKKYSPVCENMEGFSVGSVCIKKGVRFFEIRAISNYVGDRDNWKIKDAIAKLNRAGEEIIAKAIEV